MKLVRRLVCAVALTAMVGGCEDSEPSEVEAPLVHPIDVSRIEVVGIELVVPVFGTGTIAAHKSTEIGPRVDGIIEEIFVKVGDRVQAGDPLFRTRQIHYQIRLDEDRMDEVTTAFDIAAARVGKAKSARARATQDLEDTTVRAPYSGSITRRYVDEGAMVRTMMSANSPVVQIMKMDIVATIVQIPEVHLAEVHLGTPARLKIDGVDHIVESVVYILNDLVDPVSRAFEVRLPIHNEDYEIKPGLFVQAELLPEPRSATVVDRGAVLGVEGNRYVFVEADGGANRRSIKARDLDALRFEVLGGLSAGEPILSGPNLRRLSPGTPVVIEASHANR